MANWSHGRVAGEGESAFSDGFRDGLEIGAGTSALSFAPRLGQIVPQGTLAERIRAGGAGIPAFYTPSAVGTPLAEGKECREFGDRKYLLEHGIRADFSLIKGRVADTHGNILYNKTARNFGPLMAMAAKVTIVQVAEIVEPGKLDPESIVTPGIFVDRVVAIANPAHESELVEAGASYP